MGALPLPPCAAPPRVPNPTLVAISFGPVGAPLVGALPLCAPPRMHNPTLVAISSGPVGAPLVGALPSPLCAAPPRMHNPTLVAISSGPVGAPLVGALPSPLCAAPPRMPNPTLVAISFRPVGAPLVGALPSPLVGAPSYAQPNARCHIIRARRGTPCGCPPLPPCVRPRVCTTQRSLPYHPGPYGHPSWAPSPLWAPPPREHNPALIAIQARRGPPLWVPSPPLWPRPLMYTTQRSLTYHSGRGTPRGCPPPSWAPFCRRNVDTSPLALHRLERVLTKMPKASPTDGRQFLN